MVECLFYQSVVASVNVFAVMWLQVVGNSITKLIIRVESVLGMELDIWL